MTLKMECALTLLASIMAGSNACKSQPVLYENAMVMHFVLSNRFSRYGPVIDSGRDLDLNRSLFILYGRRTTGKGTDRFTQVFY